MLGEGARLAEAVLAPLRRAGDLDGARLENGIVRATPGFAEAYRTIAEGGWVGIAAAPEHGGMGLPMVVLSCLNEMFSGANLALALCPLLTQGQIEALDRHACPALKAIFLPRLVAGEWTGTMNLTEPQAGSDVGAVRTRAEAGRRRQLGSPGRRSSSPGATTTWRTNIVHLVLARLPDGAARHPGHLAVPGAQVPAGRGRAPRRGERGQGDLARAQDGHPRQPDLRHGVTPAPPAGWSAPSTPGWPRCSP